MAFTMRVAVAVMGFWRAAWSLMGFALSPCARQLATLLSGTVGIAAIPQKEYLTYL